MQFEDDFKAALREGKADKVQAEADERANQVRAALVRSKWQTSREDVLREMKRAVVWLQEQDIEAIADKRNGTEVFLQCAAYELRFSLDLETYKVICSSSFPDLDEQWDVIELFSPVYVQDRLILFARMLSRVI
jgi:hypothetical protein